MQRTAPPSTAVNTSNAWASRPSILRDSGKRTAVFDAEVERTTDNDELTAPEIIEKAESCAGLLFEMLALDPPRTLTSFQTNDLVQQLYKSCQEMSDYLMGRIWTDSEKMNRSGYSDDDQEEGQDDDEDDDLYNYTHSSGTRRSNRNRARGTATRPAAAATSSSSSAFTQTVTEGTKEEEQQIASFISCLDQVQQAMKEYTDVQNHLRALSSTSFPVVPSNDHGYVTGRSLFYGLPEEDIQGEFEQDQDDDDDDDDDEDDEENNEIGNVKSRGKKDNGPSIADLVEDYGQHSGDYYLQPHSSTTSSTSTTTTSTSRHLRKSEQPRLWKLDPREDFKANQMKMKPFKQPKPADRVSGSLSSSSESEENNDGHESVVATETTAVVVQAPVGLDTVADPVVVVVANPEEPVLVSSSAVTFEVENGQAAVVVVPVKKSEENYGHEDLLIKIEQTPLYVEEAEEEEEEENEHDDEEEEDDLASVLSDESWQDLAAVKFDDNKDGGDNNTDLDQNLEPQQLHANTDANQSMSSSLTSSTSFSLLTPTPPQQE